MDAVVWRVVIRVERLVVCVVRLAMRNLRLAIDSSEDVTGSGRELGDLSLMVVAEEVSIGSSRVR